MTAQFTISDLHDEAAREALQDLNNASAKETSLLTPERFDEFISAARVALFVPPAAGLLLAFEDGDDYDGAHFLWFRAKFESFIYIDRVIIAQAWRRHGLGNLLYDNVFEQARKLGRSMIACEVNLEPPNPVSDQFHAALGFREVGRATTEDGAKTVRYLVVDVGARTSKHASPYE